MPKICILTDSTAQFTQANFPGHEHVYVIPFDLQDAVPQEGKLPPGDNLLKRRLIPPAPQDFARTYARLSRDYDSIVVLLLSSLLSPTLQHAISASDQYNNSAAVEVIDSQTTAVGLGMLVQLAAGAVSEGVFIKELVRRLRANIPHIYMLFCIPELTFLANSGYMDYAQAIVGEMMGMLPVFAFEEGRLVPMEKVRTPRHLLEAFQDFMSEFETPSQIALSRSLGRGGLHTNSLRQFVKDAFPGTLYSEQPIQPHLAALFGPRSIGLAIMDSVD